MINAQPISPYRRSTFAATVADRSIDPIDSAHGALSVGPSGFDFRWRLSILSDKPRRSCGMKTVRTTAVISNTYQCEYSRVRTSASTRGWLWRHGSAVVASSACTLSLPAPWLPCCVQQHMRRGNPEHATYKMQDATLLCLQRCWSCLIGGRHVRNRIFGKR